MWSCGFVLFCVSVTSICFQIDISVMFSVPGVVCALEGPWPRAGPATHPLWSKTKREASCRQAQAQPPGVTRGP